MRVGTFQTTGRTPVPPSGTPRQAKRRSSPMFTTFFDSCTHRQESQTGKKASENPSDNQHRTFPARTAALKSESRCARITAPAPSSSSSSLRPPPTPTACSYDGGGGTGEAVAGGGSGFGGGGGGRREEGAGGVPGGRWRTADGVWRLLGARDGGWSTGGWARWRLAAMDQRLRVLDNGSAAG